MMRRFSVLALTVFSVVFIAGCGKGGAPAVVPTTGISFSAPNATVTFASTAVGASAGAQAVTVTNTGNATINLTTVLLTGSNPGDFSMSGSCVGITSIAANATCSLSVNFTPTTIGARAATINFQDSTGTPHLLSLTGTGTASLADFSPSPGMLLFPTTVAGSPSSALTLSFVNNGTGADTVSSVAISGTNSGEFAQTNNCTTVAASGGTCTISVIFTPALTATGARSATLTVTDNSNGVAGTTHIASLSGTAAASAAPTATVSPSTLSFTSSTAQSVTVTNTGASAVTVSGITITGTNASVFAETNSCGTSIAIGASCSISVTFAPGGTAGSFAASLNIADNVTGSPQTVALSGTAAPVATFSPTSLSLSSTTLSTPAGAKTITLTNTGTASMAITGGTSGVTLTGTNASNFAQTNTCTSTLAVNASCTISVTFTPTVSGTATANVSVADNAAGSPQTVAVTGYGPGTSVVSTTLVTIPDQGFQSLYNFVTSATSTLDMTIYELADSILIGDMVSDCKAGVKVRVILDNSEKSTNTSAYNTLNAQTNCTAVFSNTHFVDTHEKSVVIDAAIPAKAQVVISTGNFDSYDNYYLTGRDFQLYENDANDVAAVEATFQEDFTYSYGTTYPSFTPPNGDDLFWSPTNAATVIGGVISGATKTLVVDQEEMSSSVCYQGLATAAQNGVSVKLTTPTGEITSSVITQYPASGNYLYIHAKAIVADAGTPNEKALLGSENCSTNSLNSNRELGLVLTDSTSSTSQAIITSLNTTLLNDYNCVSLALNQTAPDCTQP